MNPTWYQNRIGIILLSLGMLVYGILALTGHTGDIPAIGVGLWSMVTGLLILVGV